METLLNNGDWNRQTKLIRDRYSRLTTLDMRLDAGGEHALVERMRLRLKKTSEQVIDILKSLQPTKP